MQKELGEKKFYSQFYLFSKLQKLAKMTKKWLKLTVFRGYFTAKKSIYLQTERGKYLLLLVEEKNIVYS